MDLIDLFEKLATSTLSQKEINQLIHDQPEGIKQAFMTNNATQLKEHFCDINYLADKSAVVQYKL